MRHGVHQLLDKLLKTQLLALRRPNYPSSGYIQGGAKPEILLHGNSPRDQILPAASKSVANHERFEFRAALKAVDRSSISQSMREAKLLVQSAPDVKRNKKHRRRLGMFNRTFNWRSRE